MPSFEDCGYGCHVSVGAGYDPDSVWLVSAFAYHVETALSPGRFDAAVGLSTRKHNRRFSPDWPGWYLSDYLPYQLATLPHFIHSHVGSRERIGLVPGRNLKVQFRISAVGLIFAKVRIDSRPAESWTRAA